MKKRLLSMILAISMVLTFLPVSAVTAFAGNNSSGYGNTGDFTGADGSDTTKGKLQYSITKEATDEATGEVSVVGWNNGANYNQNVTIPQAVEHDGKTYTVTGIGDQAFSGAYALSAVSIPNSVTSIGDYAFSNAPLCSVTIPGTVQTVGAYAFYCCKSLKTLEIQNGVTSIGEYAFYECTSLTSVTIPATVATMGKYAFRDCTGLTSINIQNSVIGESAFYGCIGLTSVTIPAAVTTMGQAAFRNCTGLTSINIQNSVIGAEAFYGCTSLNAVTVPATVTSLGTSAFENCTTLSKVIVNEGVTSIGAKAFFGDKLLSEVSLPETLVSIGSLAFYNCPALTQITIPSNVTSIGDRAFAFPDSNVSETAGLTSVTIPESVVTIGSSAFRNCKALTEAHLPSGIKTIPDYIFYECTKLTTVNIPGKVASIGKCAFYGCSFLKAITVPDSVKSIGNNAFFKAGLTSIKLPEGVEALSDGTFAQCPNLTAVELPGSLNKLGYNSGSFASCPNLTTVTFNSPGNMTVLENYTFSGCSKLNSVTLPDSLLSIRSGAFKDCSSLKELTLPDKVTSIGAYAFENCTSLKNITIPQYGMYYLSIGSDAFKNCTSLEKIYYKGALANLKQFKSGITGLTISDDNDAVIEYTDQTAIPVLYTCIVTLDPGNGTLTDNQIKVYHTEKVLKTKANKLTAMPEPTPASSDNVFAGWYTDAATQDDTTKFNVDTSVTADMNLYAVYTLKTKGVTVTPGVTVKDADGNTIKPDGSGKVSVTPGQEITLSPTTKNDGDAYEWTISGNGSEQPATKTGDSITITVSDDTEIKLSTLKALHITEKGEPDTTGTKYDADKNTYYGNGWEYSKNDGLTIKETKDLSNEPAVKVAVTVAENVKVSNARLTKDVTNNGTLSNCVLDKAPTSGTVENSLFGADPTHNYTNAKTLTEADGKKITAALTDVKDGSLTGETLWFVGTPTLTATVENNTAIKHINHDDVTKTTIDGLNSFTVTGDSVTFTPNGEKDILLNNRTAVTGDFTFTTPDNCTYDGNAHKVEDITSTTYEDGEYTVKYDYKNPGWKEGDPVDEVTEAKDAGTYTVKIVMSDGQTIDTGKSFTISPAKPGENDFEFVKKLPSGVTEDRDDSEKTAEVQLKSDSLFNADHSTVTTKYQKKNANGDWEKVTAPSGKGEYRLVATVTPKDTTNLSKGTVVWEFTILDREDANWLTMSVEDGKITKVTRPAADDAEAEDDITEKVLLTASADGSKTAYKVPAGAQVTVTANDAPQDMKFEMWRFSVNSMNGDTTLALYSRSMTFTLKDDFAGLTVSAMYQDAAIDSGYDILGPAAAATTAVVGSAILAYQGHMLGTELYLIYLLPSGAVIPANRIQLAMLLWQDAGNPAPVDETPYSDIDSGDTDAMQAAQWAVETGLMELPDADNAPDQFDPYAAVSNVDVIHAWKKAQKVKG